METEYRILEEGEIVQEGDEVDAAPGWNDKSRWEPAGITVGKPAPNPNYPAHRIYRRRIPAQSDILIARAMRLSVVQSQYDAGNLSEDEARELLSGPLSPGDESTIIDDSSQLKLKIEAGMVTAVTSPDAPPD